MTTTQAGTLISHAWGLSRRLRPVFAALLIVGTVLPVHAGPQGGVVRAGTARITEQANTTLVEQRTPRAIIDWRSFAVNSDERVQFAQPSATSATLNRVTGKDVSLLLGRLDANGQILLINPNGIVFGKGAQINVGSLIASTANISNDNFMRGKLVFDQPGKPGAGVANFGSITVVDGGLVALVAPHVRNDGLIQARLGKVLIGAADTFTIDLYGDGLINLALNDESLTLLKDSNGQPIKNLITQAGTIDVGGGQAILVTAEVAKGMVDSLINMSGTILADSAVQEGGRIVLCARGGSVEASGHLSAAGTTGGQIDILGDQIRIFSPAHLDASGLFGGGILRLGGAFQGGGSTYRAQSTFIDPGVVLQANALQRGNGGEVIVWSDGSTFYGGSIFARGGAASGDGGRVEVSGKGELFFDGSVDAGATYGKAGSLLLDPYDFTIGAAEAGLIDRVLRTGTGTSVTATHNLTVNYAIDGRGRIAGGGLTLLAGNDLNINNYIITNNGAINLFATAGSVTLAPDKVIYAGAAPITVKSGADLYNGAYLTGGTLSLRSTMGSVFIDQGIAGGIGNLVIQAAHDVNINQPIVSLVGDNSVNVAAGNEINIDGQIDGRTAYGSSPDGSVAMTAGQNINLRKSILARNINLTATAGTINAPTMNSGITLDADGFPQGEGLFAGTGPIGVTAGSDLSSGLYVTTGPVSIRSTGGNVGVDTKLAEVLGNTTITADTGSVNVNQEIANIRSGSNLAITAGTDINLNKQIDALDDTDPHSITPVAGGSIAFVAGSNVNLNKDLVTYNGAVTITASAGTLNIAMDDKDALQATDDRTYRIETGSADISVTTGANLSTGTAPAHSYFVRDTVTYPTVGDNIVGELKRFVAFSTTGKLSLESADGDVTVDAPIPGTTGGVSITAHNAIVVNQKVFSSNEPIELTAGLGGITVNTVDDSYGLPDYTWCPVPNITTLGSGDVTLSATGPISISTVNGISAVDKLTIDTRDQIIQGSVNPNWSPKPSEIDLIADKGINSFLTPKVAIVNARSTVRDDVSNYGDIHLTVDKPEQLTIEAARDVYTGMYLGANPSITAHRDINLENVFEAGKVVLHADRDANLKMFSDVTSLDVWAGRNISFSDGEATHPEATIWVNDTATENSLGLRAVSVGGNVTFNDYSAIHIGGGKKLEIEANDSVELGILETNGDVGITTKTGNIVLRNDIGAPIQYYAYSYEDSGTTYYNPNPNFDYVPLGGTWDFYKYKWDYCPYPDTNPDLTYPQYSKTPIDPTSDPTHVKGYSVSFDPEGIGVASLSLTAGGDIDMQGAKAAGHVTIEAEGNLTHGSIYSGTLTGSPISISAANYSFSGASTGNLNPQQQLELVGPSLPGFTPGPALAAPAPPGALTNLPAPPPDIASAAFSPVPTSSGGGETEQVFQPERAAGSAALTEIIPGEDDEYVEEEEGQKAKAAAESQGGSETRGEGRGKDDAILDFPGGRGVSQTAVAGEILGTSMNVPYASTVAPHR